MIEIVTAKAITTAILSPLIGQVISGAKQAGAKGFQKWEQSKYHAKIQKKIASIESLKTFWSADNLVSLTDFYYPSKITIDGRSKHCQLLSELPEGNLIIEGIVGQGKSIYLRHLATSEIRSNQSIRFPIFIEFRTLSQKITLDQAIKNYLDEVNIDGYVEDTFEYVMSSGNFVLLLDAFDEIEEVITKDTYLQIEHYVEKYEKLKIIITSRPSAEIQKSPKFLTIKLSPLREADYTPFLSKLGLPAPLIAELKDSIKNSPSKISQLITTPLMLTLVVRAYKSVKEIPENLPDFFEVLFKCVFSGHDNAKPYIRRTHSTDLSEKKLQELFETFCFVCMKNKVIRSLSTSMFDQLFDSAVKLQGNVTCEAAGFRNDMHKVACLILPDGFESWVFLHKSIMEYYSASFIRRSNESFAIKFYKFAMNGVAPWMEVLTFLQYIDEYRFNKYYLLPEIDIALSEMNFIDDCIDSDEVVKYLEKIGQHFSLEVGLADSITVRSVTLGGNAIRFCTKNSIDSPLLNFFRRLVEDGAQVVDPDFLTFLKNGADSDKHVTLNLKQALKLFGDKGIISEFKLLVTKISKKRIEATRNIELNESRCDFLEL